MCVRGEKSIYMNYNRKKSIGKIASYMKVRGVSIYLNDDGKPKPKKP